jgi:starch-binding outer membrane protein SusE/F
MKNIVKILFLGVALMSAWSCKKDEIQAVLNPTAALTASLSKNTVVLLKDSTALDALSVSWVKPNFGFDAAPSYTLFIDKAGNNFAKAVTFNLGAGLSRVFKVAELNSIVRGLGLEPGTAGDLDVKVQCLIGDKTLYVSPILALKATAFADKLDLFTNWGLVGDATANGWNGPDMLMWKNIDNPAEIVAYATLVDGNIKFRTNNDWAVNLGGTGGVLKAGGDNIAVTKGSYKITFNPTALTYKVEKFSWGVVGNAMTNGWNGPDQVMEYDGTVNLFRADITVNDGDIKFRRENDWAVNLGGTGGVLSAGGGNIAVKKGRYLVTMDPKALKYTVTAYKPWGIVGDATETGWGDKPDKKFTYDLSTETWFVNGVVLKGTGGFKFRENDDWGNNLGAAGTVEPAPIAASGDLAANGKNFAGTAGTWNFVLDLRDKNKPVYKATKK